LIKMKIRKDINTKIDTRGFIYNRMDREKG